jgi:hypothetical protein
VDEEEEESILDDKEEESTLDDNENEASEGDKEAQALAKIVDSDAEEDDASPNEETQDLDLPEVPKKTAKTSEPYVGETGVVYVSRELDKWQKT